MLPFVFWNTNIFHQHYKNSMDEIENLEYLKLFGKRIKELRKKNKMSQSELGGKAELEKTAIQRIERGHNSTLNTLLKVAKAFDLTLSELFDLEN